MATRISSSPKQAGDDVINEFFLAEENILQSHTQAGDGFARAGGVGFVQMSWIGHEIKLMMLFEILLQCRALRGHE